MTLDKIERTGIKRRYYIRFIKKLSKTKQRYKRGENRVIEKEYCQIRGLMLAEM